MSVVRLIFISAVIIFLSANTFPKGKDARSIVNEMTTAIANTNTLSFTMEMEERINGKFVQSKVSVKLQVEPQKIYIYSWYPNKGAEILYTPSKSSKALVNPNGFPFFNVSFSPFNAQMRKNKHHTILSMGFEMLGNMINEVVESGDIPFDEYFQYGGDVDHNGKSCYKIVLNDADFGYQPYALTQDETLYNLANRMQISEYLIKEKNGISGYGRVKKGTTLLLPTSYAKKTELYVDKSSMLPIVQIMHDEKGIFERYEYSEVLLNPEFNDQTFSKDNPDYGF
ncbi:MAG: DUF1571 domain-containing protein [Bacteroidota bacterium]